MKGGSGARRLSPLERFGAELRAYRKDSGLSQARIGERLGCSQDLISQIELAKRCPSRGHAERLDQIFGLSEKKYFIGLYRRIAYPTGGPQWFLRWAEEIEPKAAVLRGWDPLLVPGLLQVQSYARYVFQRAPMISAAQVEERVTNRMQRKTIFDRSDPPALWVLLDEGVLHRPVGGPAVMCEQLNYLLGMAGQPNITIQIVPIAAACTPGLMSAFALAEQLPGVEPDTVYVESAAEGLVTADEAIVNQIRSRYDSIRADAFHQGASLMMIKDAHEQWLRQI
jgi:transcriptional regulator with XRE-family HTH domain